MIPEGVKPCIERETFPPALTHAEPNGSAPWALIPSWAPSSPSHSSVYPSPTCSLEFPTSWFLLPRSCPHPQEKGERDVNLISVWSWMCFQRQFPVEVSEWNQNFRTAGSWENQWVQLEFCSWENKGPLWLSNLSVVPRGAGTRGLGFLTLGVVSEVQPPVLHFCI